MAVHTPTGAASPTAHDFGPDGDRAPARSVLEIVRDVAGVGPNDIAPEWRLLWSSAAAAMAVGASGGLGQLTPPPNQQSRDLLPATVSPNVQRLSVPRPVLPPPPSVEPARPSVLPDVIRRNVLQEARSLSANQVDDRRAPPARKTNGRPHNKAADHYRQGAALPRLERRRAPAPAAGGPVRKNRRRKGGLKAYGGAAPARRAAPPAREAAKPMPRVDADALRAIVGDMPNVKKKEMLLEMLLDYDGLPPGVPSFAGR
ncbi:unnamed protein product [Pelagomonas calceolata]|jgi:hypothetical protein|uniref:Uncharacterized protein n=1 Tax=Pelagomonas calceolata TaxID=35677 RepID=A0A8J2T0V2_9STRA|nr:unnamed protein product [Pelagomonas calceolata]